MNHPLIYDNAEATERETFSGLVTLRLPLVINSISSVLL
jgi:hypothetical protein